MPGVVIADDTNEDHFAHFPKLNHIQKPDRYIRKGRNVKPSVETLSVANGTQYCLYLMEEDFPVRTLCLNQKMLSERLETLFDHTQYVG